MVSAKGIIAAISVFAAAVLTTDGATSAGLEPIQPGEASFIFAAEEFSGTTPVYMKNEDDFYGARTDLGIFRAGGAHAVIVYLQTTNDETVIEDAPTLKNTIDSFKFNEMNDKEWGRSSLVETHLGKFGVVAYRIASKIRECFGFSLEFDFDAHDDLDYRFTKLIYGYYCAKMGDQLSPDKITNLIRSISVNQGDVCAQHKAAEQGDKSAETPTLRDKPDRDLCTSLPYGNPDFAKEAERRELTEKKCKEILGQ